MSESYALETSNSLEEKCLDLANHLIHICKVPSPLVSSMNDINSNLFILLFETITNCSVPDFVHSEDSVEEAHNVQAVIDTLSLDILGLSLSHITGEDVVAGDVVSIFNLLEIFEGIMLFLPSDVVKSTSAAQNSSLSSVKRKSPRKVESPPSAELKLSSTSFRMKRYTKYKNKGFTTTIKAVKSSSSSKSESCYSKQNSAAGKKHHNALENKGNGVFNSTIDSTEKSKAFEAAQILNEYSFPRQKQMDSEKSVVTDINSIQKPGQLPFKIEKVLDYKRNQDEQACLDSKKKRKTIKFISKRDSNDLQNLEIEEMHEKNLVNKIRAFLGSKNSPIYRASELKKTRLLELKRPIRKAPLSTCRKSFLLPHNLRHRSVSNNRKRTSSRTAKFSQGSPVPKNSSKVMKREAKGHESNFKRRSLSHTSPKRIYLEKENSFLSKNKKDTNDDKGCDAEFIQQWKSEFPGLKLPIDVLNCANKQYEQQLKSMHCQLKNRLLKKSKSHVQAENAVKRQSILSNLLKKDIEQGHHLVEVKQHQVLENTIKYRLRDARLQSAKVKQYCDEFHVEMQKKMQKRNYSEELVAENVFKEVMKIQREHVQQLCDDVKETDELDAKHHQNYLDALENVYKNQFAMLAENLSEEKKSFQERIQARRKAIRAKRKALKDHLQLEVREMQKNIVEAMQDTHFRELDAEQYKNRMRTNFNK